MKKRTIFCLIDGIQIAVTAMAAGSLAKDDTRTAVLVLAFMFAYMFSLYRDSRIEE